VVPEVPDIDFFPKKFEREKDEQKTKKKKRGRSKCYE